jgi:CubicO group peptidase (beta-lactamase class C family)
MSTWLRPFAALLVALCASNLAACSSDDGDSGGASRRAPFPAPAWEVRTAEEQGMDQGGIDAALAYAFGEKKHTQGVVVVRGRAIVAERYEPGRDERAWAASWSVAKSFTSAAVGIAIDQGLIANVDVPMTDYFPNWAGTPKESIRLRHVLNMASGLAWAEDYDPTTTTTSDVIKMVLTNDALAHAETRPAANPPGTEFNYSSGDTMLVSRVLEVATGSSAEEFATQHLFTKIGMGPTDWWRDARSRTLTYCCLDTPSREFAKLGLLFLERGTWDGAEVVPESWVQESLAPSPSFAGYGYFWWLTGRDPGASAELPEDTFSARGHDGQYIYVIPSLDLVVVRNGRYDKHPGDSLADPNLIAFYPQDGFVPERGTRPPEDGWSDAEFLGPIVRSIRQR